MQAEKILLSSGGIILSKLHPLKLHHEVSVQNHKQWPTNCGCKFLLVHGPDFVLTWDFSITATISSSEFNITSTKYYFLLATFQIFQCNLAEERIGTKFLQEHQVIHYFYQENCYF